MVRQASEESSKHEQVEKREKTQATPPQLPPTGTLTQQFTPHWIPPEVWTEATLDKYIDAWDHLNDVSYGALDKQREREHRVNWFWAVAIVLVVAVGLLFMYAGVQGGSQIVTAAIAFVAGAAAGRGWATGQSPQ